MDEISADELVVFPPNLITQEAKRLIVENVTRHALTNAQQQVAQMARETQLPEPQANILVVERTEIARRNVMAILDNVVATAPRLIAPIENVEASAEVVMADLESPILQAISETMSLAEEAEVFREGRAGKRE